MNDNASYEAEESIKQEYMETEYFKKRERDSEMEMDAESYHSEEDKNKAMREIEINKEIEILMKHKKSLEDQGYIPTFDLAIEQLQELLLLNKQD